MEGMKNSKTPVRRDARDHPRPSPRGDAETWVSQGDASLRLLARALFALAEELLAKEGNR
jgi:hypothetical protein